MATKIERTDVHRASTFIVDDYKWVEEFGVISFDAGDYIAQEEYGYEAVNAVREQMVGVHAGNAEKCDVCGANYVHGSLWLHIPSGGYITIGQTCAGNVSLFIKGRAKKSALKGAKLKLRGIRRRLQQIEWRREGAAKAKLFLAEHVELRIALTAKHNILHDMSHTLVQWGGLSKNQEDFAIKLAKDIRADRILAAVPIPAELFEGRNLVTGHIVGTKEVETFYSYNGETTTKMVVKVPCEGGEFTLYGTVPDALGYTLHDMAVKANTKVRDMKGLEISFMCRIKPTDDDKSFGIINRPTKIEVLN